MDDGDDMHLPHRERVHGQLARLMAGKVDSIYTPSTARRSYSTFPPVKRVRTTLVRLLLGF